MQERMQLSFWKGQLDEMWLENMAMIHRGKSIEDAVNESFGYLISDPIRLQNSDASDFKRLVNGWLSNKRHPKPTVQKINFNDL